MQCCGPTSCAVTCELAVLFGEGLSATMFPNYVGKPWVYLLGGIVLPKLSLFHEIHFTVLSSPVRTAAA
jgi:hypothetical protein